jgi:uncharacterized membrane protein
MTIGPVQLLVLGFDKPDFRGEIIDEFERLRENDTVRVIDALVVFKDAEGEVAVLKGSQLSKDEAMEFGGVVGGLLGLGAGGEEGMEAGAIAGAEAAADGVDVFDEEEAWDVLEELPNDAAAALILLEHRWAQGCRPPSRWLPHRRTLHQPARSHRGRTGLRRGGREARRRRFEVTIGFIGRRTKEGTQMMPARRVARRTSRRTSRRMADAQTSQQAAPPPAAAAAPAQQDDMAQIQQLATMKDQGLLTEEEFQAKKKQILGI